MQRLADKHGFPAVDRALRFFAVRAKSRPETAELAAPMVGLRATLRASRDTYLERLDERVALTAEIVYLDDRLDRLVLVNVKRDLAVITAEHPSGAALEKKLFQGVAPSVGMRPVATGEQEHYVAGIITRIEEDHDFAALLPDAKKLRKAQKELAGALARRKDARVAERMAAGDLEGALDDARRAYNQLHPRLQLLFPEDPALVESYFCELRSKGDGGAVAVDEEAPEAEGAGAAEDK